MTEISPEEENSSHLSETEYEYESELTGPILLQELPTERLANMVGYALREGASPMEIREAVEWLNRREDWPGTVPYQDDRGFLARQPYCGGEDGDEDVYSEWIEAPCLLVIRDEHLECWGHVMIASYGWQVVAQW